MADRKGGVTTCSAELPDREPHPMFGPMVCGRDATGPHPDPAKGYREPLCAGHLAEATAALADAGEPS